MTFDEWSDALLVAVLKNEDATGKQHTDLELAAQDACLDFNEDWAVRFLNEQRQYGTGDGSALAGYYFSLTANGRFGAKRLQEQNAFRTLVGRFKAIS